MNTDNTQILDEAVARNSGVVLSYPSAGMLRHYKSRFVGECAEGVWVESSPRDAALADALIASAEMAGCSFKSGHARVVFTAPLLRRDSALGLGEGVTVEAVLLSRPAEIKAVQRRSSYRVRVPADYPLTVNMWRIGRESRIKDRPLAACQVPCKLLDISMGGLGVVLESGGGKSLRVHSADRLRVEIRHEEQVLLLEGRMCFPPEKREGDTVRAGIAFVALEDDLEGRRIAAVLTRINGALQRIELRKLRLGIS